MYERMYELPMKEGAPLPFALPQWLALAPFEEYLGMKIVEAGEGKAVLTMPFTVKLAQGWGLMHGGAVAALADTALAIAIKTVLEENSKFATIEMGLKFRAPVTYGLVRAEARIVARDDRTIKGETVVIDEKGTPTAVFTAVFKVKRQE